MDRADLLALCRVRDVSWNFLAREIQRRPDLKVEHLIAGHAIEDSKAARETAQLLHAAAPSDLPEHRREAELMIASTAAEDIYLTTVLDDDYPVNLRVVDNLPPFLYRGQLKADDAYSVAVVGTRAPSEEGVTRARKMATWLAEQGVTILSGLARGIDAAAHVAGRCTRSARCPARTGRRRHRWRRCARRGRQRVQLALSLA